MSIVSLPSVVDVDENPIHVVGMYASYAASSAAFKNWARKQSHIYSIHIMDAEIDKAGELVYAFFKCFAKKNPDPSDIKLVFLKGNRDYQLVLVDEMGRSKELF